MLKHAPLPLIGLVLLFLLPAARTAAPASSPAPQFASVYTDLNRECKDAFKQSEINEGSDMPLRCKGFGGYHLYIYYSAWASHITVRDNKNEEVTFSLATQALSYSDEKGRKIEWRMADGVPFAAILRVANYNEQAAAANNESPFQEKFKSGESLLIKGLKGFERIDAAVDAKAPNANLKAREMADNSYRK
jgi:hypothetical protein